MTTNKNKLEKMCDFLITHTSLGDYVVLRSAYSESKRINRELQAKLLEKPVDKTVTSAYREPVKNYDGLFTKLKGFAARLPSSYRHELVDILKEER